MLLKLDHLYLKPANLAPVSSIHGNSNISRLAHFHLQSTLAFRLADTPLLRTLAITDKIQIPGERSLTKKRLPLLRTLATTATKRGPSVCAITRLDCTGELGTRTNREDMGRLWVMHIILLGASCRRHFGDVTYYLRTKCSENGHSEISEKWNYLLQTKTMSPKKTQTSKGNIIIYYNNNQNSSII